VVAALTEQVSNLLGQSGSPNIRPAERVGQAQDRVCHDLLDTSQRLI
jgi:hypothetical protein